MHAPFEAPQRANHTPTSEKPYPLSSPKHSSVSTSCGSPKRLVTSQSSPDILQATFSPSPHFIAPRRQQPTTLIEQTALWLHPWLQSSPTAGTQALCILSCSFSRAFHLLPVSVLLHRWYLELHLFQHQRFAQHLKSSNNTQGKADSMSSQKKSAKCPHQSTPEPVSFK